MNDLKPVYQTTSAEDAEAALYDFMSNYQKLYPKAIALLRT